MIQESRSLHLRLLPYLNVHSQHKAKKKKKKEIMNTIVSAMAKCRAIFSPKRILNILNKITLCLGRWGVGGWVPLRPIRW